jgi:hypothetical protein
VASALIRKFEQRTGLHDLLTADAARWRHVLASIDGPFWSRIDDVYEILARASGDAVIHENCSEFFRCLCAALKGETWPLKRDDVCGLLSRHAELAPRLWTAVLSRPIQFRLQSEYRDQRQELVAVGVEDGKLPLPDWWVTHQRYQELTGRSLPVD